MYNTILLKRADGLKQYILLMTKLFLYMKYKYFKNSTSTMKVKTDICENKILFTFFRSGRHRLGLIYGV